MESPSGMTAMIASGQEDGSYTVQSTAFEGEPLAGNWKVWIEDTYGDGGHQATSVTVKFVRSTDTGDWLSANPTEGSIAPGGSGEILITCSALDMPLGTYSGRVIVLSNDPDQPEIEIHVTFMVTINTGIEAEKAADELIRAYPNPTGDLLNLEISSPNPGTVYVSVTDLSGKTLINQKEIQVGSGTKQIQLNLAGLQHGCYLLRINSDLYTKTLKIIRQ